MEIEQKFRVDDPRIFDALRELQILGDYALQAEPAPEQQRNIYFDTPDGRLRAAQYGLRIRELEGRRIVTLKGPGAVHDGRHEREEYEVEIGDDDRPTSWPASPARDRTLALIGDQPLAPLLTVTTTRHHIIASLAGTNIAELSLDHGSIQAAGRSLPFRELEIELLEAGTTTDLDTLCTELVARFSLVPDDRSKLARGLELLGL